MKQLKAQRADDMRGHWQDMKQTSKRYTKYEKQLSNIRELDRIADDALRRGADPTEIAKRMAKHHQRAERILRDIEDILNSKSL